MRLLLGSILVWLGVASLLWGAMTDTQAYLAIQALWGPRAYMGKQRWPGSGNWQFFIGVRSPGCATPELILGKGFNSWDAAFADLAAHAPTVAGPFAGEITIKATVTDDVQLAAGRFVVDGLEQASIGISGRQADLIRFLDTASMANGIHVVCVQATDTTGNLGKSPGYLIRTDQSVPSSATEWMLPPPVPPIVTGRLSL